MVMIRVAREGGDKLFRISVPENAPFTEVKEIISNKLNMSPSEWDGRALVLEDQGVPILRILENKSLSDQGIRHSLSKGQVFCLRRIDDSEISRNSTNSDGFLCPPWDKGGTFLSCVFYTVNDDGEPDYLLLNDREEIPSARIAGINIESFNVAALLEWIVQIGTPLTEETDHEKLGGPGVSSMDNASGDFVDNASVMSELPSSTVSGKVGFRYAARALRALLNQKDLGIVSHHPLILPDAFLVCTVKEVQRRFNVADNFSWIPFTVACRMLQERFISLIPIDRSRDAGNSSMGKLTLMRRRERMANDFLASMIAFHDRFSIASRLEPGTYVSFLELHSSSAGLYVRVSENSPMIPHEKVCGRDLTSGEEDWLVNEANDLLLSGGSLLLADETPASSKESEDQCSFRQLMERAMRRLKQRWNVAELRHLYDREIISIDESSNIRLIVFAALNEDPLFDHQVIDSDPDRLVTGTQTNFVPLGVLENQNYFLYSPKLYREFREDVTKFPARSSIWMPMRWVRRTSQWALAHASDKVTASSVVGDDGVVYSDRSAHEILKSLDMSKINEYSKMRELMLRTLRGDGAPDDGEGGFESLLRRLAEANSAPGGSEWMTLRNVTTSDVPPSILSSTLESFQLQFSLEELLPGYTVGSQAICSFIVEEMIEEMLIDHVDMPIFLDTEDCLRDIVDIVEFESEAMEDTAMDLAEERTRNAIENERSILYSELDRMFAVTASDIAPTMASKKVDTGSILAGYGGELVPTPYTADIRTLVEQYGQMAIMTEDLHDCADAVNDLNDVVDLLRELTIAGKKNAEKKQRLARRDIISKLPAMKKSSRIPGNMIKPQSFVSPSLISPATVIASKKIIDSRVEAEPPLHVTLSLNAVLQEPPPKSVSSPVVSTMDKSRSGSQHAHSHVSQHTHNKPQIPYFNKVIRSNVVGVETPRSNRKSKRDLDGMVPLQCRSVIKGLKSLNNAYRGVSGPASGKENIESVSAEDDWVIVDPNSSDNDSNVGISSISDSAGDWSASEAERFDFSSVLHVFNEKNVGSVEDGCVLVASDGKRFCITQQVAAKLGALHGKPADGSRQYSCPGVTSDVLGKALVFVLAENSGSWRSVGMKAVAGSRERKILEGALALQIGSLAIVAASAVVGGRNSSDDDWLAALLRASFLVKEWSAEKLHRVQLQLTAGVGGDVATEWIDNENIVFDMLWYLRCCYEFKTDSRSRDSMFGMWKNTYAELRVQKQILNGIESITGDELDLWDSFIGNIVTSIDLSDSNLVTDDSIAVLSAYCPNIQFADLHGSQITNQSVEDLSKNCRRLLWLNIESTKVTNEGVETILTSLPDCELVC